MATSIDRAVLLDLNDDLKERLETALGSEFAIERELGGGGMSRVYMARDERLDRDIVVKVLEPDLAQHFSVERFEREIRVVASLQAPHIVPLIAAGHTADGLPYYTMPFVRGESLRARLGRVGALPVREGIAIMRDVAKALVAAHDAGVMHRDIKPENILISSGSAVVTDFGIAKALAAAKGPVSNAGTGGGRHDGTGTSGSTEVALTQLGTSVGTPAYSAPEQALGDPATDHRADLYSWGAVAYEVLTGHPLFPGRTTFFALVAAHATEQPDSIAIAVPQLPTPVADVIMRCLEKDPAQRPPDAAEVLSVLDVGTTWTLTPARRRIIESALEITDDVIRRIHRKSVDPRLFGRSLQYLENDGATDVLLVCFHGLGQDAADFTRFLESTPHRALAATQFGFERGTDRRRVPLGIEAHIDLTREFIRQAVARIEPQRVILVGFSSGADIMLRLLAANPADEMRVDAGLALGPNLSLATCFASRVFAGLQGGDAKSLLADLQRFGAGATTLDEWLNVMAYVLEALRKFRDDVAPLSRFAADILQVFESNGDAFANFYRGASERVRLLRCVFEESETCTTLVQELRLRNLDADILGPRYRSNSIVVEAPGDHFALLEPARIERHIESILAALTN